MSEGQTSIEVEKLAEINFGDKKAPRGASYISAENIKQQYKQRNPG
jgi:hypothetical protein